MPRNGSGTYSLPYNWETDKANDLKIIAERMQGQDQDIANALTQSIAKDGQTPMDANLPMGGYTLTGMGNASARNQAPSFGQVQDSSGKWAGTAGGTADAITISLTPTVPALVAGQEFNFVASADNTGSATLKIGALDAKAIKRGDGGDLIAGDIKSGQPAKVIYDGTNFSLVTRGGASGGLIGVQYLTTSGTYTPTPGTKFAVATMYGGGGAGGGAVPNEASVGGGGGSGAQAVVHLVNPTPSAYTIGAAGVRVPGASGGSGGSTIFAGVTCTGGTGGLISSGLANATRIAAGGAGGTVSGGSPVLSMPGQRGGYGCAASDGTVITAASGGEGAGTTLGLGGSTIYSITGQDGDSATGYGAGGSGAAMANNGGSNKEGGAGRPGIIIIQEYA